jgi:hypothetical protein
LTLSSIPNRFPSADHEYDEDGLPKWISFGLHWWKHRANTQRFEPYMVRCHRNYVDNRFDVVWWTFKWLGVSKIVSGPLFPQFEKDKKTCRTPSDQSNRDIIVHPRKVSKNDANESVNMSYNVWSRVLTKIFHGAGYDHPSICPYSLRKSAVKWAARCGADIVQIKNAGRWSPNSTSYHVYIEEGELDSHTYKGMVDPIREIWFFRPTAVGTAIHSSL